MTAYVLKGDIGKVLMFEAERVKICPIESPELFEILYGQYLEHLTKSDFYAEDDFEVEGGIMVTRKEFHNYESSWQETMEVVIPYFGDPVGQLEDIIDSIRPKGGKK